MTVNRITALSWVDQLGRHDALIARANGGRSARIPKDRTAPTSGAKSVDEE